MVSTFGATCTVPQQAQPEAPALPSQGTSAGLELLYKSMLPPVVTVAVTFGV